MARKRHLLEFIPARRIESRALEIAHNASTAVLQRLTQQVTTMGEHEARGYVQSRARAVVDRQASLVLAHRKRLPPRYQTELTTRAIGHTVDLVMCRLNRRVAQSTLIRKAG